MKVKYWVIIFIILCVGVFLFPLVYSIDCLPNELKLNRASNLTQTCDTCSFVNISSITFPNGTTTILNTSMNKDGTTFMTDYTPSVVGTHYYNVFGDKDGGLEVETLCFEVTNTGFGLTSANSTIFIGLLALMVFLLIVVVIGIGKLPPNKMKDDDGMIIGVSNLKYLRPVLYMVGWAILGGIFFLASNLALAYLGTKMFGDILFAIYKISNLLVFS